MISKSFHRILDQYRKQTFTGPPENVRDHIMAATRSLTCGNWDQAYKYVAALNSWALMPRKDEVGGGAFCCAALHCAAHGGASSPRAPPPPL
jgi:hypothetical protein